jgi:hypothetical protein
VTKRAFIEFSRIRVFPVSMSLLYNRTISLDGSLSSTRYRLSYREFEIVEENRSYSSSNQKHMCIKVFADHRLKRRYFFSSVERILKKSKNMQTLSNILTAAWFAMTRPIISKKKRILLHNSSIQTCKNEVWRVLSLRSSLWFQRGTSSRRCRFDVLTPRQK